MAAQPVPSRATARRTADRGVMALRTFGMYFMSSLSFKNRKHWAPHAQFIGRPSRRLKEGAKDTACSAQPGCGLRRATTSGSSRATRVGREKWGSGLEGRCSIQLSYGRSLVARLSLSMSRGHPHRDKRAFSSRKRSRARLKASARSMLERWLASISTSSAPRMWSAR